VSRARSQGHELAVRRRERIRSHSAARSVRIRVDGAATDRNAGCGDGIDWSIDKGATMIATGAVPNGGSQAFADGVAGPRLSAVPVTAGQFLYFIVGPGPNHDHQCDSTQLNIKITAS
jgi:hypothetical protein